MMYDEHTAYCGVPDEVKRQHSEVLVCAHCGNKAPMQVLHQHSDLEAQAYGNQLVSSFEGYIFEWLRCHSCLEMMLRRFHWIDGYEMRVDEVKPIAIYPIGEGKCRGLPPKIMSAYRAAEKVKGIDANAYGVLVGRVLEMICTDKGAEGKSLDGRIKALADSNQIPPTLADVAHGLRGLRNVGAHADLGELSAKEIPIVEGLLTALIEYLYTAPSLVVEAQTRLNELKQKSAASPS